VGKDLSVHPQYIKQPKSNFTVQDGIAQDGKTIRSFVNVRNVWQIRNTRIALLIANTVESVIRLLIHFPFVKTNARVTRGAKRRRSGRDGWARSRNGDRIMAMEFVDLVLDTGEFIRIECPEKFTDELHETLENSMKRKEWWSVSQWEGCSATFMGIGIDRIAMWRVIGTL
jgi:hypothetical protein